MSASGGQRLSTNVCSTINYLVSACNDTRAKVAILLTDGQGSGGRAQARTAADRNITIHTIGFGGADGNKLSDIATITNGTYNYVEDASELPNVFSRVTEEVEPEDSDGDGLPDVLEENGLPIGHTGSDLRQLPTNATDKHTDGDELTDGEEAEEYREYPIDFVVNDLEHEYIVSYFELDEPHDLYLMAGGSPRDFLPNSDATGVNIQAILRTHDEVPGWARTIASEITDDALMVFTENINAGAFADPSDYNQTPYTSELQLVSAGVGLHELGHSFHIGEADDTVPLPGGEVYTADENDGTLERVKINGDERLAWSLMRSGWRPRMLFQSNSAAYHVFSLEELSTIQRP
ncbi:VWA domain-containing protein [Halorhabdus tiamatea]|uniref:Calcium-binding protein-like protein n=1 Tax=Halorhabdus tiamatea SARL4B TaxID=1033806 RepID=F7PJ96_9EURY|nr:VWA domain-containing protein [Halorhabdus tiamatea]CCQ34497.1 calcium-binding protein-like protein [Halorhabdus tiamatea SARL4B]